MPRRVEGPVSSSEPSRSRLEDAVFGAKRTLLRRRRLLKNLLDPTARVRPSPPGADEEAWTETSVRVPLWNPDVPEREWMLEAGKVENLRQAARRLHDLRFEPGQRFSFWQQVGRPSRARGFVEGRELRGACVVPTTAGGICALSGALCQAARRAGLVIVERHRHTRSLDPDARDAQRRRDDATLAWPDVDLRLVADFSWRLEVRVDADALWVCIRAERPRGRMNLVAPDHGAGEGGKTRRVTDHLHRSCVSCDRDCYRARKPSRPPRATTAYVVDAAWPEFSRWIANRARPGDTILSPLDARSPVLPARLRWFAPQGVRTGSAPALALARSLALRRAKNDAQRQRVALDADRRLARALASLVPIHATELVVSQTLLPWLARLGVLGGRRVRVLATRLPLADLHARLQLAAARHPQSPTLKLFRAPTDLVADETSALARAEEVLGPHSEVIERFGERGTLLPWGVPWSRPRHQTRRDAPPRLLLPSSALARKGAYELLEVLRHAEVELWVAGRATEVDGFWGNQSVHAWTRGGGGSPPLTSFDALVLPAWVEHQPRALLEAVGKGVPVIASNACGLVSTPGVTSIPTGDGPALRAAIDELVAGRYGARAVLTRSRTLL